MIGGAVVDEVLFESRKPSVMSGFGLAFEQGTECEGCNV